MKCEITGQEIKKNFLGKLFGTVIKDKNGKKHYISNEAQAQYNNNKEEILSALK